MISRVIGKGLAEARDSLARALVKTKVSPNALTVCGMITNLAAGLTVGLGHPGSGAGVIIFSSIFDILDGPVAKLSGRVTKFGAFLDSSLDRYSDGAVFIGIIIYLLRKGDAAAAAFAFSAMVGSFLISYTRARAENVIESCKVGYWERGERTTYIIIGLLCGRVDVVMYMLGVLTHITVLHRMLHTWSVTNKGKSLELKNILLRIIFADFPRKTIPYDIITGIYILIPFGVLIIDNLVRM